MLEDPGAPNRGDYLKMKAAHDQGQAVQPFVPQPPPHYHYTLVTVSPLGALEQLMSHLGVVGKRWVRTGGGQGSGHHLSVDGLIYSIGNDWLVRFGHVMLAGGSKGMLIEVCDTMYHLHSRLMAPPRLSTCRCPTYTPREAKVDPSCSRISSPPSSLCSQTQRSGLLQ